LWWNKQNIQQMKGIFCLFFHFSLELLNISTFLLRKAPSSLKAYFGYVYTHYFVTVVIILILFLERLLFFFGHTVSCLHGSDLHAVITAGGQGRKKNKLILYCTHHGQWQRTGPIILSRGGQNFLIQGDNPNHSTKSKTCVSWHKLKVLFFYGTKIQNSVFNTRWTKIKNLGTSYKTSRLS
jgi:hypothetical protein